MDFTVFIYHGHLEMYFYLSCRPKHKNYYHIQNEGKATMRERGILQWIIAHLRKVYSQILTGNHSIRQPFG